ncbi:PH domain-containing protein [Streptomyces uncialis]|uniref:PH domain-containing protein n=1 Tax=Streptomyces uncialis TaxID=1048205 RepID=UPI002E34E829|nr:PH domain-containing protein [Streptomyces uncialis]WST68584.1 PH domain-containing protein [Streptomyces uncialis]WTE12792.1 PH domain-containing protein [Streptomyces uncialis]
MTSSDRRTPSPPPSGNPEEPVYQDRVFRSSAAIAGGVLLLALGGWLGVDALVRGEGTAPWLALATLLFLVPLVVAYTLRPAVFVNEDRLRIRNPFRTITLPWSCVGNLRAGYSNEVFDDTGVKYQLWAVPVSLRARKKAARQQSRAAVDDLSGRTTLTAASVRSPSDQTVEDLRELAERRGGAESAQGRPQIRWAYEILGPSAAGAVLLAVVLALT